MARKQINDENERRVEAYYATLEKDLESDLSKIKNNKEQKEYFEEMYSHSLENTYNGMKQAHLRAKFIRGPENFDSGEGYEEKKFLKTLSEKSKKEYANLSRIYEKYGKARADLFKYREQGKDISSIQKKMIKMLREEVAGRIKYINSRLEDHGLFSDDYTSCLLLSYPWREKITPELLRKANDDFYLFKIY